jgi:hypothetical protein
MTSFWDKVERRQKAAAEQSTSLRDLQIELWGWCDERPRDWARTRHNGWAGNLLRPPPRRNGGNIVGGNLDADAVVASAADGLPVTNLPAADLPAMVTPAPSDARREVQTLAELFEYVSAAWDPGGSSYCATKTWFGCGLDDVFQGLASKEGLSATERSALSARMRNAMPLCGMPCRCAAIVDANPRESSRTLASKLGAKPRLNCEQTPDKMGKTVMKTMCLRCRTALPVDLQGGPQLAQAIDFT